MLQIILLSAESESYMAEQNIKNGCLDPGHLCVLYTSFSCNPLLNTEVEYELLTWVSAYISQLTRHPYRNFCSEYVQSDLKVGTYNQYFHFSFVFVRAAYHILAMFMNRCDSL